MSMTPYLAKSLLKNLVTFALPFFISMVIAGCADNPGTGDNKSGNDADVVGSISFSIILEDNIDAHHSQNRFACGNGNDLVTTVTAQISNGEHTIQPNEVWACSDGQGTISGVPVGSNYTLTVVGHNANGQTNYCAQRIGITVLAGPNDVGEIVASRFQTIGTAPPSEGTDLDPDGITFRWEETAGATGYLLLISEFADLSNPIIEPPPSINDLSYSISSDSGLFSGTQYWWAVIPDSFDAASGYPYPDMVNTFTTAQGPLTNTQYQVEYANIMYRSYESGSERYQILMGISDNGGPCVETEVIDWVMKDSMGSVLPSSSDLFYRDLYMWYTCDSGGCSQAGPFNESGVLSRYVSFSADSYAIEIEMENGQLLTEELDFPGLLVLPFVSINSMAALWDGGDLELSWVNPTSEGNWIEVDQLRIVIFDDLGNSVLYIRVSPGEESVVIPSALITQAVNLHGSNRLDFWQVQTRAYDSNDMNFSRAYSDNATLP